MIEMLLLAVTAITAVRDSYPSLSPDGRNLVFHSNRSGRQAIWMAKADGGEARILFDWPALGTDPGTPVWSPDGKSIAFGMRPAGASDENESDIYVMNSGGSHVLRLTSTPGDDSHPHWSADGKRIFFNSARATPDLKADWSDQWIDIYSMARDGSDVRRHTDCREICTYPVPSPDGRFVVHRRTVRSPGKDWEQSDTARNSEIFLTPLDGGPSRNLTQNPAYDGWPMWSPDGRWIVFASNRDSGPNVGQVYRMRTDGSTVQQLTTGPFGHVQPSFSVDGKSLYTYQVVEQDDTEVGQIARFDLGSGQ